MTDKKVCRRCGLEKSNTEFRGRPAMSDGLESYCKDCKKAYGQERSAREDVKASNRERQRKLDRREYYKSWRKSDSGKEYRKRRDNLIMSDAEKARRDEFRVRFNRLVARGDIPHISTQVCQKCGNPAKHYHHYNGYEEVNILDVIPLCLRCHAKEHGREIFHQ
jgi:ribosomal protein L40E